MFIQAIQFILSIIAQLFSLVFNIQLASNITFGGVIVIIIIATILIRITSTISGLAEFRTEANPYKNQVQKTKYAGRQVKYAGSKLKIKNTKGKT